MNIFLVDDDFIYADFIKKALGKNSSYKIAHFATAEEALKATFTDFPQVFIIDYKLPRMNGIELYEKLKPTLTKENKVIMLSALEDGDLVLTFIQKGVREYVIKDENVIDSLVSILDEKEDSYYF